MSRNDSTAAPVCARSQSSRTNLNGINNGPILPPPALFDGTELIPPPPEFNQVAIDEQTNIKDTIIPPPKYFQSQPSENPEQSQSLEGSFSPSSLPPLGSTRTVPVVLKNTPNVDSNSNEQNTIGSNLQKREMSSSVQISPNSAAQVRPSGNARKPLPNMSSFKSFKKSDSSGNCVQSKSTSVMTQLESTSESSDISKSSSRAVRKCSSEGVINKSHSSVTSKSSSDRIEDVLLSNAKPEKPSAIFYHRQHSLEVRESTEHTEESHRSLDSKCYKILPKIPAKSKFQREERSRVTESIETTASSETLTETSSSEVERATKNPLGTTAMNVRVIIKHESQSDAETKDVTHSKNSDVKGPSPLPAASINDVINASEDDGTKCEHGDGASLTPRQIYFEDFGAAHRVEGDLLNAVEDPTRLRSASPRSDQGKAESTCNEDEDLADLNSLLGKLRADRLRLETSKMNAAIISASQEKCCSDSVEIKEYKQRSVNVESEVREHIRSGHVENNSEDICRQLFPKTKQNEFFFGREDASSGKPKFCTAAYFHGTDGQEGGDCDKELDAGKCGTDDLRRGYMTSTPARGEESKTKSKRGASEEYAKHAERKEEVIRIPRPLSFVLPEMSRLSRRRSQESTHLMRPCESSSVDTSSSMNTSAPVSPVLGSRSNNSASEQPVGNAQSSEYLSGHSRQSSFDSHLSLSSSPMTSSTAPVQSHFVVVAIDFGTTYSGYAFSFTRDPESIHMMRRWEGGDPGIVNQKTPTTLLLQPDGTFHSFGFTARDFYHDLDAQEGKKWLYFEKFKMALHHNAELSKETMIKASNGKSYPALSVFSHALRFFKDHALQELSDQSSTTILNEDIRWVITVPAIWKAPAKQFMRQASYQAGIASIESANQLLIALEPEAASIYVRKLRLYQLVPESTGSTDYLRQQSPQQDCRDRREATPDSLGPSSHYLESDDSPDESVKYQTLPAAHFKEIIYPTSTCATVGHQVDKAGTRYMVVDCGGGTVDITVYEMEAKYGQLKELHKATGGPFGSLGVDMEFERMMIGIFGAEFMDAFKLKRPAGWVDLMTAFESRKRTASPFKNNSLNVSLPFSFIDYYKKCKGGHVEAAIRKYGNRDVCWSSQGMLRLTTDAMRRLFQPTLDHIKQAVGDVLNSPNAKDIQFLFLVGGFSESPILQLEMRKEFGHLLRIIIPQDVGLTILKGAVCFGLDPTVVCVRRSRLTYGVGVLNRFVPGRHPPSKLVRKQDVDWCMDVFDKYVEVDQSVALGDTVVRSYTPAKLGQKSSIIHIYCTDKQKVEFITEPGVKKCGTLCLDLTDVQYQQPAGGANKRREIHTRMTFGDTEIKVTALDVSTGKCVRSGIDFLNK